MSDPRSRIRLEPPTWIRRARIRTWLVLVVGLLLAAAGVLAIFAVSGRPALWAGVGALAAGGAATALSKRRLARLAGAPRRGSEFVDSSRYGWGLEAILWNHSGGDWGDSDWGGGDGGGDSGGDGGGGGSD